jgi:glycosyltransferase involved in cell wall biosynthesis
VAIVHYWLVNWRGGEKVLQALLDIFPSADLYVHVFDPKLTGEMLPGRSIRTTFINRLPFARKRYQLYLPLMPLALEQLDLSGYDLVISSESGPAKGVLVGPDTVHICYCHSPMRYAWDMYHSYRAAAGWFTRLLMMPLLHYIRIWDFVAAARVDDFVANSEFVARRLHKCYRRDAKVIHPPVDIDSFSISHDRSDFYLIVGQLVGYKRADIAVEAFTKMGVPLVVIGEGEQLQKLRRIAGANVKLMGWQPNQVIREHYSRCRALIFPGIEDFGMVPVEAMATGKPVIAYRAGGAKETVVENVTGIFFEEQTTESLMSAVRRFESAIDSFDPKVIRRHAESFSAQSFKSGMLKLVASATKHLRAGLPEIQVSEMPQAPLLRKA